MAQHRMHEGGRAGDQRIPTHSVRVTPLLYVVRKRAWLAAKGEPMRVVVLDDYQNVASTFVDWSAIDGLELASVTEHVASEHELAERLRNATVVVAMRERTPLTASLFERLPHLRLVVTTGPSNTAIDLGAAATRRITVCGTGGMSTPTSELTWALIHGVTRHVPADDATIRRGGWQTRVGFGLAGQQLGLIGLGRIGALVARVGLAFGMDVVAWSHNLNDDRCRELGVRPLSQSKLLSTSDVVSIHLVLSERTRGLIGVNELAMMRRSAVLINTSRGPIVDEGALIDALSRRAIAGVGLDVFDVEPLPADHAFRSLPNTVLTPHTGYVVSQCYEMFYREVVEDILAWQSGAPIRVVSSAAEQ